jgi:prevent-host-death family protein
MSNTVGAYQAKTHLAALLDRVEKGEQITITRHGRAVAMLVPPPGSRDRPVAAVIEEILAARRGRTLGPDLTVRDLISSGRR